MDTEKLVLTSAFVTLGSTVAFSATPKNLGGKGELPSPRLLIGTGVTYFALSVMADTVPGIAGPMAAAIAITALTLYGLPILDNYMNPKNPMEAKIHTGRAAGPPAPTK